MTNKTRDHSFGEDKLKQENLLCVGLIYLKGHLTVVSLCSGVLRLQIKCPVEGKLLLEMR